ncbi:anti-sigma factor family protein [Streptomyces sp. NPDC057798]|uniref:anti-sigma factor family protein n=1 Tax=Streptomyces sp. NPDC057798 TaxID=3346252 RepID=UPI0036785951
MTSTTDTAGHPDVTELSDLTEGLLPASRSADVRQHLHECELCADVYASLEEIRGLLGTLPGPPRMPADVAGRIDAALAAEALLNATAPEDPTPPAPLGTPQPSEDDARVSRETSVTADRPAGHARPSSTGPGRKERRRGGRRRIAVLGTVFTVAALGLGSVLLSSLNDGPSGGAEGEGRQSTASDTFAASTLEQQVDELLAAKPAGAGRTPLSSMGVESVPSSKDPHVFKQPTVPGCVQDGIGRNDGALVTEEGVYQGTEALLVVLSHPSDSTKVTAYIVDTACVRDPSVGKGDVLLTHTYTRTS